MGHTTSAPLQTYGFFAYGTFTAAATMSSSTACGTTPVAIVELAREDAALTAVRDAVLAFDETRKLSSFQRAECFAQDRARHRQPQRRLRAHHLPRGGQADPDGAPRSRSRHLHLRSRCRRSHAHLWRVHPARHAGNHGRPLGPDAALPAGPGFRHHAVQFPAESRGPQNRAGDCRGLPDHPQARPADSGHLADAGWDRARVGMAGRRAGGDAACRTKLRACWSRTIASSC